MKHNIISILLVAATLSVYSQEDGAQEQINSLIDTYARARETKDSNLLKHILTSDIDQLVSTGEWRKGLDASLKGMQQSSTTKPGSRTLTIEKLRFLSNDIGIVDTRYVIQNPDGSQRKMWSTFIVVREQGNWKITAIRNMLPTGGY